MLIEEIDHPIERASGTTELRGLKGAFYSGRLESEAATAIKDYRTGETIAVRVVNGLPYADTIDWFRLGAAFKPSHGLHPDARP